jgi:uncharacterized protein (DUF433 family)
MAPDNTVMADATLSSETPIVRDPAIRGGEPVLRGTATPVRALAELWNQGLAAEEIPLHLPHLKLEQVFAALHYYLCHRQEIDSYIAANHIPDAWSGKRFDPATGRVQ